MRYIFLFTILSCIAPLALTAQLDDLLNDPNVTYLATFEAEHDFRLATQREGSKIQLLKFSPTNECYDFKTDNWVLLWLLEGMKEGKYRAFEDPELSIWVAHSTLLNKISTVDTVITFNPETYEERMQIIRNDINAADILSIRTYQAIFFDKKLGSYGTRLLAVAPMVSLTDATGQAVGKSPIAWLKMDDKMPKNISSKMENVNWAALLMDRNNTLEISKLKVKKNVNGMGFSQQLFKTVAQTEHPIERTDSGKGYGCGVLTTATELEQLFNSVDTIITFDPETYKETIQVVKNCIIPEDVKKIMLVQEWYFDDRRKVLCNRLKAVAPMIDRYDETGHNVLYSRPLYYLKS